MVSVPAFEQAYSFQTLRCNVLCPCLRSVARVTAGLSCWAHVLDNNQDMVSRVLQTQHTPTTCLWKPPRVRLWLQGTVNVLQRSHHQRRLARSWSRACQVRVLNTTKNSILALNIERSVGVTQQPMTQYPTATCTARYTTTLRQDEGK